MPPRTLYRKHLIVRISLTVSKETLSKACRDVPESRPASVLPTLHGTHNMLDRGCFEFYYATRSERFQEDAS